MPFFFKEHDLNFFNTHELKFNVSGRRKVESQFSNLKSRAVFNHNNDSPHYR